MSKETILYELESYVNFELIASCRDKAVLLSKIDRLKKIG